MVGLEREACQRTPPCVGRAPGGRFRPSLREGLDSIVQEDYICIVMQTKNSLVTVRDRKDGCCPGLAGALEPSFFKALCDPSRSAIAGRLAEMGRACTVSEMASCCPVDISVVSRHLAILRRSGIVVAERKGREVLYRINTRRVVSFLRDLADRVERCGPRQEGRLPEAGGGEA